MVRHDGLRLLGLTGWPFSVVPKQGELVWADRSELLRQIRRLVRRLSSHQSSTLHLLWADFGAGKTHTLRYLQQLARDDESGAMFPVYTALPRAPRSFVDIYRAIVRGVGFGRLLMVYDEVRRAGGRPFASDAGLNVAQGLRTAFEGLRIGSAAVRDISIRWLTADPSLTRRELIDASLPGKIRTTDDALAVLSAVTALILLTKKRVLLMVDEFQRTGMLRQAQLNEMNAGLHTYFNDCPEGLSVVLSFSFGSPTNIQFHLNEELRSRADPEVLTIREMDMDSAREFLADLLATVKVNGGELNMRDDVLLTIVGHVAQQGTVTPRRLVHAASTVFLEAGLDLEEGVIGTLDSEYARTVLAKLEAEKEEGPRGGEDAIS